MVSSSELIVSVSGVRGIIGSSLTPQIATSFAAAFGSYMPGAKILISNDGRSSSGLMRHAVLAGLISTGAEAIDLGVLPTPTCGVAVRALQASGAIQITASHNPAEWNGLKMFGPDGRVLPSAQGAQVKQIFESGSFHYVG